MPREVGVRRPVTPNPCKATSPAPPLRPRASRPGELSSRTACAFVTPCAFRNPSTNPRSPQRERWQRPRLPGQQARIMKRAAQDEPRHRVDVRRHRLAPEPHGFQWNRPAPRERVEHPRRPSPRTPPGAPPGTLASSPRPSRPSGRSRPESLPSSARPPALGALDHPAPPSAPAVSGARPGCPDPATASPATPPDSPPTAAAPARCAASRCARAGRSSRGRSRGRPASAGKRLR